MTHGKKFVNKANAPLGVSRRRFLNRAAMGLGLPPFASSVFGTALALDQRQPTNVRVYPTPPPYVPTNGSTLRASDFSYLGAMRLPTSGYPSDEDPSFS